MYVYVPCGAIYESPKLSGASHFLEHMLFKNKGKVSSNLSKSLTYIGGTHNAVTYKDVTYYYILTHMSNYKEVVDMLYQITRKLSFTDDDLVVEKQVVLQEMGQTLDSFDYSYSNMMQSCILDMENVYTKSVIGNRKSVSHMSAHDLKEHARNHYKDCSIIINCDESILGGVKRYVSHVFGPSKQISFYDEKLSAQSQKFDPKIIVVNKPFKQYSTCLIFKAFPAKYKKENIVLKFLQYCLTSSGLHSILNHNIRVKRGLVYTMHSYSEVFRYIGLYYISFSSNSSQTDYIINLIMNVLYKLKSDGMSKNVMKYYKNSYLNTMKMRMTNDMFRTEYFGLASFYGVDLTDDEFFKIIKNINNDDIMEVSKKAFNFTDMGVLTAGAYNSVNSMSKRIEDVQQTYAERSNNS
jgi:predicted Zn-dependent peptidase